MNSSSFQSAFAMFKLNPSILRSLSESSTEKVSYFIATLHMSKQETLFILILVLSTMILL